jgi:copper chaperone CopZ
MSEARKHHTGHAATDADAGAAASRMYAVEGMTCSHCAASVTEEVEKVAGVTGIDVDLDGGRIVVQGAGFSDEAIREAVDEAGYHLVAA